MDELNINKILNREVIEYELKTSGDSNKIIFKKYENKNILDNKKVPITNNLYDYVLFFILHLNLTNR